MERRSWTGFSVQGSSNQPSRVIEPELDMNRRSLRVPAGVFWLRGLIRVLVPAGRLTGPPMRSVGRELEEAWPSLDH